MSYLATPIDRMARSYDVVIVGSGYGGAINASRLARAGLRVCLLERGEEFQPGDFPESPTEGMREIQLDWPDRRVGSRTALFDFRVNPDVSALIGCGLGGTSLINANVAVTPDERVWLDPVWPEALRADVERGVAAGFERTRAMLRPTPLPADGPTPDKLVAMERSARAMGRPFLRAPIVVNFEDRVNHVGVEQPACNHCGNCVGGCNTGAKNALTANYLPDAANHGAEIFTRTSVRTVERTAGGWLVRFELLEPGAVQFGVQERFVAADTVILSAGSLGSTEILLRSRARGLSTSDRLGERFTGNGDVLGFAYNSDVPIGGVGIGSARGKKGPGPCITGIIDYRGAPRLEDTMVIEEGVIPSSLGLILATSLFTAARMVGRDTDTGLRDAARETLREIQALVPGGSAGAVGNTQTFLVMAQDDCGGRIELVDDRARISWPRCGHQEIFARIDQELYEATAALGGTFVKNPLWTDRIGKGLVTVHPLGGCGMGETAETGVVDHRGRVFAGPAGDEVHPGLYVSDGAVIPRSLGVNPFLTISALAERTAEGIARERGRDVSYDLPSRPRTAARERRVGIEFTEAMRGFFSSDPSLDYEAAAGAGERDGRKLDFTVTVASDDLEEMLRSPRHEAALYGTVEAPALSSEPLVVSKGVFGLLSRDESEVRTRRMTYRMPMVSHDGTTYFLSGFKSIKDDQGFDLWADTTTLFVTVHEGSDDSGPVVGRGILKIQPRDFVKQLRTLKVTNAGSIGRRLKAMADFGAFFAGSLYETYGGVLARRSDFAPDAAPRTRRELLAPEAETYFLAAADGAKLRLLRYPGGRTPVLLLHGLGMSGRIFAIDTVDTNLVERLAQDGYDVWVLDNRASVDLPGTGERTTLDEIAQLDVPAALAKVRAVTGAAQVDVVAHGFGAMSLLMGLVEGAEGVRSAVCMGAGLHLVAQPAQRIKAGLYLPGVLKALGQDTLSAQAGRTKGWKGRLLDVGLRLMPVEAEEWCTSSVCRRVTLMYGPLYEHDQLNLATHEALHELFGDTSVSAFEHASMIVRKQEAVRADGTSYLRDLQRLALPILFLHGEDAACFLPESTSRTVAALSEANGAQLYRQRVIPAYGDLDCVIGKNAVRDVFPHVLEHLEAVAGSERR